MTPSSPPPDFLEATTEPIDPASSSASISSRRWDDPPEHEPPGPAENATCMIFVEKHQLKKAEHRLGADIQRVAFTPGDTHIVTMNRSMLEDWSALTIWSTRNFQQVSISGVNELEVHGSFALAPLPDNAVACPYFRSEGRRPARIEIYDIVWQKRRVKSDLPIQAPLAWSPDGTLLAGVSVKDTSRIYIVKVKTQLLAGAVPHHLDEVTHMAFTPDGSGIVSLSKDGSCKITSLTTGRVLWKFEVTARHNPLLLQISPDGETVASVWGRDVMVWSPSRGTMITYTLSAVRQTEGCPLAISQDCKHLVCRSEDGFDISDLRTGRFLGELATDKSFITAAGFSSDNRWLAIGKHNGAVLVFEVVSGGPVS